MTTPTTQREADERDDEYEAPKVCVHALATRPVLYTDTVGGNQTCRDDLWAVTTDELNALAAQGGAQQAAATDQPSAGQVDERDNLAEAIRAAAVKAGIIQSDAAVTGPQLVMLCDELARASLTPTAPQAAAPSYWNSQRKMIERAIIGLRDGWATRKDADDALAALSGSAPQAASQQAEAVAKIVCPGCYGVGTYIGQHDGYDDADCSMCDGAGKIAPQATTTASASIDADPEFQRLAEYWRGEPYGTRSFLNAWDELVAYIDLRAALARAPLPGAPSELVAAADAVVERWHSRDWKLPHTADFIGRLATAVGTAKRGDSTPLPTANQEDL